MTIDLEDPCFLFKKPVGKCMIYVSVNYLVNIKYL